MEKKDLLANYAASKQNMCITNDTISDRLFQEYGVNRGLRDTITHRHMAPVFHFHL